VIPVGGVTNAAPIPGRERVARLVFLVALISVVSLADAQPRFEIPLTVTDDSVTYVLHFGILPAANFCISLADSINGHAEEFLPPEPPEGVFDTRFKWPRAGTNIPCFDQGSPCDFRPYTSTTQRDSFRVRIQLGQGSRMILSWPAGLSDRFQQLTLRYFDQVLELPVTVDMIAATSANVTNAGTPAIINIYSFSPVTPPEPPPAPALVSPPDGATGVSLQPVLTWNVASGATSYRLQVARDSLFTMIVFDDSTITGTSRQVGPLLPSTPYYWRVRGKNISGSGSYSPPFRFTTLQAPSAPGLVSPPDGALNVSLVPVLTWNSVTSAASYRLQVARDSLYAQLVVDDSTLTGTSRQVGPLSPSSQYFWHVRAQNAAGASPYSVTFRFRTTDVPPAPLLVSPADSATRVPVPTTFLWNAASGATSYLLQIGTSAAFTTLLLNDSTITTTSRTVANLPYSAVLWWRVRGKNSSGSGEFAAPRVFTLMMEPPSVPTQILPPNNQINVVLDALFRWNHAVLAAGYHLQIAHDTLMTNMFYSDSAITDSSKNVRLAPSAAYYWRVRARNLEGTYGAYSSVRRFTTSFVPPLVPIPLYPANGDTTVPRNVTIRWVASPGALTYRFQLATDIGFTQLVNDDSTVTIPEFTPATLGSRVSYFWRVRAKGTDGSSAYCAVQSFRTTTLTSVEQGTEVQIPPGFVLNQNYPNPFNPSTTVPFELASPAFVVIRVYDLLGREIRTLIHKDMAAGMYSVQWNGRNDDEHPVPSGMYFVRMTASAAGESQTFAATRKVVLLK
jgi:hypothetical protein